MTLTQLIASFRSEARDQVEPYLWTDAEVKGYFNDAEQEAATRALLLYDDVNASVCDFETVIDEARYALHEKVLEIRKAVLISDDFRRVLDLEKRERLNDEDDDWEGWSSASPTRFLNDETAITLVPKPDAVYSVHLSVFRLPMDDMAASTDEPEIHQRHHQKLIEWALYRAYSKHDQETYDPQKASMHEAKFERFFGKRPDANVARKRLRSDRQVRAIAF